MVSQAGSVPSYFRRFRERAMLSLMPLMIYFLISSLPLPLLTQIQGSSWWGVRTVSKHVPHHEQA